MDYNYMDKSCFIAHWINPRSNKLTKFNLAYYTANDTLEMVDLDTKKLFLKRIKVDGFDKDNLYVGSKISIFNRNMKIVDYGNELTKQKMVGKMSRTFAIILPDGMARLGDILNRLRDEGFRIVEAKLVNFNREDALVIYSATDDINLVPFLVKHIMSGPVLGLVLVGDNAVKRFRDVIGFDEPAVARETQPCSIRAIFGTTRVANAVYGSATEERFKVESDLFFYKNGQGIENAVSFKNTTLCLLKPSEVSRGCIGEVIKYILDNGFTITGIKMMYLDVTKAEEFFSACRGLIPYFSQMVELYTIGPTLALEIGTPDFNPATPTKFKEFCGPTDPTVARLTRPKSLRAIFGWTKIHNALHCTFLPEDALLEIRYFFTSMKTSM